MKVIGKTIAQQALKEVKGMQEEWWFPVLTDADWCNKKRDEDPDTTKGWDDEVVDPRR